MQISEEKLPNLVADIMATRCDVTILAEVDLAQVQLRPATENYPKSVFIRFCEKNLRDVIWTNRMESKKKGLIIEEWLTETRANIFRKLKELKCNKMIKDCFTEDGDVYATVLNKKGKEISNIFCCDILTRKDERNQGIGINEKYQ